MGAETASADKEINLGESIANLRAAITPLYTWVEVQPDAQEITPQVIAASTDPAVAEAHGRVLEVIEAMPREHLLAATRRAVAERNNDAIDQMDDSAQGAIIFREGFLLDQLTEIERADVLGPKDLFIKN